MFNNIMRTDKNILEVDGISLDENYIIKIFQRKENDVLKTQ